MAYLANNTTLFAGLHAHCSMVPGMVFHTPMHLIDEYLHKLKHFAYKKHLICELCCTVVNCVQNILDFLIISTLNEPLTPQQSALWDLLVSKKASVVMNTS
jgi:hypothetical protein